ncbi:MAG TPA: zinc ribbon domain-containing protein [Candidatus Bathyarchaeia archaeon]|nr:zinc ribbon domain-containing protein [Candidatus Bathyarchaeia archaeon]
MQPVRLSRPFGVTLIAILAILIGIVGVLGSLAIFALSAVVASTGTLGSALGGIGVIIGGVVLFFSLIWLVVGWGFASGKGWAWIVGMIVTVLSFIFAIGSFMVSPGGGILGVLVWGVMLYYLTRPGVKAFFGKGGALQMPPPTSAYPMGSGYRSLPLESYAPPIAPAAPQPPPVSSTPEGGIKTQAIVLNPLAKESSVPLSEAASPTSSSSIGNSALVSCPHCGSRLSMGSNRCSACGATI